MTFGTPATWWIPELESHAGLVITPAKLTFFEICQSYPVKYIFCQDKTKNLYKCWLINFQQISNAWMSKLVCSCLQTVTCLCKCTYSIAEKRYHLCNQYRWVDDCRWTDSFRRYLNEPPFTISALDRLIVIQCLGQLSLKFFHCQINLLCIDGDFV